MTAPAPLLSPPCERLLDFYTQTRRLSKNLIDGLSDADTTVQSMEDASPAKWHLAHTTWFFETLILQKTRDDFRVFHDDYAFLFNSYYETLGARHPRPKRGMLTRPRLDEILAYRDYVDGFMENLLHQSLSEQTLALIELGIHHEQQHQELLLTDLLHLFAQNPIKPSYRPPQPLECESELETELSWIAFEGGLGEFGLKPDQSDFAYDCESPRHKVWLEDYQLSHRLITNQEWIEFIEDDGYRTPTLWLSDGWAHCLDENWQAPLYWEKRDGIWWTMTLRGFQPVDPDAPVCHVSLFEADAFARSHKARLPTEYEWEKAARDQPVQGNILDLDRLRPAPAARQGLTQLYGDVWEWTSSSYAPYPGFETAMGAVGEYNGKFMNGQYVLRGGSCATPANHLRPTYRNFFHPQKRWQFSGVRLARSL